MTTIIFARIMVKRNGAIFIFPFALLSLLTGIIAGWQRINWDIPVSNLAGDHGGLKYENVRICGCADKNQSRECPAYKPLFPLFSFLDGLFNPNTYSLLAQIELVYDPSWSKSRMSDEAMKVLGYK